MGIYKNSEKRGKVMRKRSAALLAAIVLIGSISNPVRAQVIPVEETVTCSENSAENLENETIDLSQFCNQVDKSQEFAEFMKNLNEDESKVLVIPEGEKLLLNCYFTIPSNTTLTGGTIEFTKDAAYADVYNEAFILNRHSATYWDKKADTNIVIENVKIQYDCSEKGRSLMRFRNISNLTITGCTIEVLNKEQTTNSHNAAIDLFKGCENVKISNNEINLDNPNGSAGGAVWIRSMTVSGNDPEILKTSNVEVTGNVLTSNSCDELLAVGSSGYDTSDVLISGNTFIRKDGSKKNLMLGICPAIGGNISNVTVSQNKFYMNNTTAIMNKEIIRVGGVLDTNQYPFTLTNIQLCENEIIGELAGCKAIVVKKEETNQASVLIKKNKITNTGSSAENSYGIIATGPNILINNEIEGVETPYATDEETVFKTDDDTEDDDTEDDDSEDDDTEDDDTGDEDKEDDGENEDTPKDDVENKDTPNEAVGKIVSKRNIQLLEEASGNVPNRTTLEGINGEEAYKKLSLKATGKEKAVKLKWKKVSKADGYVIYGAKNGKNLKKLKTIKKASATSWTHKKLKAGVMYKYVVKAYVVVDGKKKWIAVSSKTYCATKGNVAEKRLDLLEE